MEVDEGAATKSKGRPCKKQQTAEKRQPKPKQLKKPRALKAPKSTDVDVWAQPAHGEMADITGAGKERWVGLLGVWLEYESLDQYLDLVSCDVGWFDERN